MSELIQSVSVICHGPDQSGYGPQGTLTRKAWQEECITKLRSGRRPFRQWQNDLQALYESDQVRHASPSFEWSVQSKSDLSKEQNFGWGTDRTSHFVLDIPAHIFEDHELDLSGYTFVHGVLFQGATFTGWTRFSGANFQRAAFFIGCNFESFAHFDGATFSEMANFNHSRFVRLADFRSSTYPNGALFESVLFGETADFHDCSSKNLKFDGSHFKGLADFSATVAHNETRIKPLGELSLSGVQFKSAALFSNREFTGSLRLGELNGTPTRFDRAPQFHNSKLHQDTTFADCFFADPNTTDRATVAAYNTLRHAMSQKQSVHEEQRFLRLELDAERCLLKGLQRLPYTAYKFFSGYGFSILRPFLWLILIPLAITSASYAIYASDLDCFSSPLTSCRLKTNLVYQSLKLSFLQSLPPLGFEKSSDAIRELIFHAEPDPIPWLVLPLTVIQKFSSLLGWFFIALALRNRFRMK